MKKYLIKATHRDGIPLTDYEYDNIVKWVSDKNIYMFIFDGNTLKMEIKEFDGDIEITKYEM